MFCKPPEVTELHSLGDNTGHLRRVKVNFSSKLSHMTCVIFFLPPVIKRSQKRNAKIVNYDNSVSCASAFASVCVQHFQNVIEHCTFRNHSSVTTSCLPLDLFITLHILPKTQRCPAGKPYMKV